MARSGRSTRSRTGRRQWHQQPTQAVPSWHLHGRSHDPARQAVLRWPKGPMPRPPARPSLGPRLASAPPLRWRRTRSQDAPNRTLEGLRESPGQWRGPEHDRLTDRIGHPDGGPRAAPGFDHAFGNGNIKEAVAVRCLGGDKRSIKPGATGTKGLLAPRCHLSAARSASVTC